MKRWNLLLFCLIIVLTMVYNPGASFAGKNLDLGDAIGGPAGVSNRETLEYFCNEVNKKTNGEINIKYHPQTIVSSEIKAVEMCKAGSLAFAGIGGAAGTIFPNVQPLMLPYLFRDYDHFYSVVQGSIGKKMEEEIEKTHRLKVVFWYDYGFRHFVTAKKAIYKPEDMQGMKLRVMQSPPLADMINALGASAVPISWAETIPAVQQGVVDGLDLPVVYIIKAKLYEICKYVAMSKHYFLGSPLIVNLKIWKEFTPDQQKMLLDIGKKASVVNKEVNVKYDIEGIAELEKFGMKINTPDFAPFQAIAKEKVYPKYYEKFKKEIVDGIIATK